MKYFSQYRGLRKENYILFFGRTVTNLGAMVWPMVTMILTQKLGMNATQAAWVVIIGGLIGMPANLLGGKLADRFNKKMVIVWCDLVSVIFYILCGLIPLSGVSVALMIIAATMQGMEEPAYTALIADLTPTEKREAAYSLNYLGANLGLVLSPTIAGLLFKNHLWLAFIISGLAIGCSTALIFFRVKNIAPEEEEGEQAVYQKTRDSAGIFQILRENRVILLYLLAVGLFWAAYQQYGYLMPLDLGRVHGETGAVIFGTVSSLNCIVVVAFTPFLTRLLRRASEPKKVLAGAVLQIAGFVVFAVLLGHVPAYYAAMLLFTWGEISATIADGPYLSRRTPASHRGRINGVRTVVGAVMAGLCRLLTGVFFDKSGSAAAWIFTLAVAGAGLVLTVFLIGRDRRAYGKLYAAGSPE